MVTGWSPTAQEEEGGVGWEAAEGASWGPGMAVVGMTEEEREEMEEEVGEIDRWSEDTSPAIRVEEGGEDTRGAVWAGGGEVSIAGGMLAGGKVEGSEVAMTAETG